MGEREGLHGLKPSSDSSLLQSSPWAKGLILQVLFLKQGGGGVFPKEQGAEEEEEEGGSLPPARVSATI